MYQEGQVVAGGLPVVVVAATSEVLAAVPAAEGLLNGWERDRAAAFHFGGDRQDYVAAHVLARLCAAAVCHVPVGRLTWRQLCPQCGGRHGRPSVAEAPDLKLSLAHTPGHVVAAAATGPIGVDVEAVQPGLHLAHLAPAVLSDAEVRVLGAAPDREVAFLRQWVRREALVKVDALTLDTLRTVDVSALPAGEPTDGWAVHRWGGFVLTDWRLGRAVGATTAQQQAVPRPLSSVLAALRRSRSLASA